MQFGALVTQLARVVGQAPPSFEPAPSEFQLERHGIRITLEPAAAAGGDGLLAHTRVGRLSSQVDPAMLESLLSDNLFRDGFREHVCALDDDGNIVLLRHCAAPSDPERIVATVLDRLAVHARRWRLRCEDAGCDLDAPLPP